MSDPSLVSRKKAVNGCALTLLGFAALFLLGVSAIWVWMNRCDRQFASQVEVIRSRNEPVDGDGLNAYYAVPKGTTDTTELWRSATEALDSVPMEAMAPLPVVGDAMYDLPAIEEGWEQIDEVEAFLNQMRLPIQQMFRAAEMDGAVRFPVDFREGFLTPLSSTQQMRSGARVLKLNARVAAHRGNTEEVFRSLVAMVHLGEALEYEPVIVSQLVRSAILGIAVAETGNALYDVPFTEEQLVSLQALFHSVDVGEGYQRAFIGERCMVVDILRSSDFADQLGVGGPGTNLIPARFIKQDTGTYFRLMEQIIESSQLPFPEGVRQIEALEVQMEELQGPRHLVTRSVLPSISKVYTARVRTQALCLLTEAAIAIQRYRLANDRLPTKLEELVPKYLKQLPMDPFRGDSSIIYVIESDRQFYLYVVGEDGVDNGGIDSNWEDYVVTVGVKLQDTISEKDWQKDLAESARLHSFFEDEDEDSYEDPYGANDHDSDAERVSDAEANEAATEKEVVGEETPQESVAEENELEVEENELEVDASGRDSEDASESRTGATDTDERNTDATNADANG